MSRFKTVTEVEYETFVANYPKPLVKDVCMTSLPSHESMNDFSDGKVWPDSIVSIVKLNYDSPYDYMISTELNKHGGA